MRFVLLSTLLLSLHAMAMDDNNAPYFSVALGRYVNENIPPQNTRVEVKEVEDLEVAGDDAETSRYHALAPVDDEPREAREIDPMDMQIMQDLFFGQI